MAQVKPPILHPRAWPAWPGIGLLWLMAQLPLVLQRVLGRGLGALAYHLMRRRRRIAERNLALCLPDLDGAARQRLLRDSFTSLGLGAFEFLRAWWGSIAPLRTHTRVEGLEHIEAARAGGRGVLLVSGHFLTLEICGRLLCDHVPVAGMYRPHRNPAMEWAVKRGRLRYAAGMFGHEELRPAVRHLRQGGILWYAPDQAYRRGEHVLAPFFGQPVQSIVASHQLARMTGAVLIPFFHRREGRGYALRLGAPLQDFPSTDKVADTARVNAAIEAMIGEAPDEYLWVHDRFKRSPGGRPRL
ncbi:MAG TPA: LpxL/LpxP family Kdo(2)-lipid IV(A) lauroyl/palmitoleoyl acyltransferase [Xanthomonadaceae bacterium]|nr:LpxL/LpxP family Kdo(2)-lipid IV(A) lauroyl/palmitoleoyl acyltransferase [Xanthomonadaceae bacterium]